MMVIDNRGALWTWGGSLGNEYGKMGLGDDRELNFLSGIISSGGGWHFEAQKIGEDYVSVACGEHHSAGIKRDGSLWVWGKGLIGDGSGDTRLTESHYYPTFIGSDFAQVALGDEYTLALKKDGSLWAWGLNNYGQLGDGTKENRSTPVAIGRDFHRIAAGRTHSSAIKKDGSLWLWGNNQKGQMGLGDPAPGSAATEYLTPVQVGTAFAAVAVGDTYTAAVHKDGSLMAWGHSRHGFGRGKEEDGSGTPQKIGSDFVEVAMDHSHTLALKRDSSLWEWGWRTEGDRNLSPAMQGTGYSLIAAGGYASAAIRNDKSLWVWGGSNWQYLADMGGYPAYSPTNEDKLDLSQPTILKFPVAAKALQNLERK